MSKSSSSPPPPSLTAIEGGDVISSSSSSCCDGDDEPTAPPLSAAEGSGARCLRGGRRRRASAGRLAEGRSTAMTAARHHLAKRSGPRKPAYTHSTSTRTRRPVRFSHPALRCARLPTRTERRTAILHAARGTSHLAAVLFNQCERRARATGVGGSAVPLLSNTRDTSSRILHRASQHDDRHIRLVTERALDDPYVMSDSHSTCACTSKHLPAPRPASPLCRRAQERLCTEKQKAGFGKPVLETKKR